MLDQQPALKQTLTEMLLYSTIKITMVKGGQPSSSGTAFFWASPVGPDKTVFLLITNKHVLEGADAVIAVCHLSDGKSPPGPSGKFIECRIDLEGDPICHPDPAVDLVGIQCGSLIENGRLAGTPLFFTNLDSSSVPSARQWELFDAIEEVLMVGCPRGIFDQANNLPIVRRGITATPLNRMYEGRPEFMVDIACFPGSSGSPVFLYSQYGFLDREADTFRLGEGRFHFLGILYAGPLITSEGAVILGQQPRIEVAAMMHLGQVIRSTALNEIDAEVATKYGG